MKRIFGLIGIALIGVFILVSCGGGGGGSDTGINTNVSDTYFPAVVGYSWTYNNTSSSGAQSYISSITVTSSSSSGFTTKTWNNASGYYIGQTNYLYDGSSLKYTDSYSYAPDGSISTQFQYVPAAIVLPSNMTSNTTESTVSTMNVYSSGTVTTSTVTRSITVNGEETVVTPAGTFTATKLTLTITTTPLGGTSTQQIITYWYVKDIGRVKYINTFAPPGGPTTINAAELISYGQTPPINTTGIWTGTYVSSVFGVNSATLGLVQTGGMVTGNFSSTTGALGNVSGTVIDDTLNFIITVTTPGCSGSFTGTGIVGIPPSGPMTMSFNYGGSSSCGGSESGTGLLTLQ